MTPDRWRASGDGFNSIAANKQIELVVLDYVMYPRYLKTVAWNKEIKAVVWCKQSHEKRLQWLKRTSERRCARSSCLVQARLHSAVRPLMRPGNQGPSGQLQRSRDERKSWSLSCSDHLLDVGDGLRPVSRPSRPPNACTPRPCHH
jgi:hypothetical protein